MVSMLCITACSDVYDLMDEEDGEETPASSTDPTKDTKPDSWHLKQLAAELSVQEDWFIYLSAIGQLKIILICLLVCD